MKLEDIGFYTLSNERAINSSAYSPIWRGEILVTDRCNFNCPYCRGMNEKGDMDYGRAAKTLEILIREGLKNVRFSGGEPTLYPYLPLLVALAREGGVERIAISTNGSADAEYYKELIQLGVNDFSISLDACCASDGEKMMGVSGYWDKVLGNIEMISDWTYCTVGIVGTEENSDSIIDTIILAHKLGVDDIRIISSAQYNRLTDDLLELPTDILSVHPILRYRVNNLLHGRNVRGLRNYDSNQCHLVLDDVAVMGQRHYPCIIYLREGGKHIGNVGSAMRLERLRWFQKHNPHADKICRENCLDVCIDFNNVAYEKRVGEVVMSDVRR